MRADPKAVAAAIDDLAYVLTRFKAAMVSLEDAQPGQPKAVTYGAASGGSGGPTSRKGDDADRSESSSVVEAAALAPSPFAAEARRLVAEVDQVAASARWLRGWADRHTPRPANEFQRARAAEEAARPVCEHCHEHRDVGALKALGDRLEVHRTGDVAGNLPEPLGLCAWCYKTARRTGHVPSRAAIRTHSAKATAAAKREARAARAKAKS